MRKKKKLASMSVGESVAYINKNLGYDTMVKPPKYWLDLGDEYMNSVFGSPKLGMAYGKLYLIAGVSSSGKSVLAAKITALAQEDGADAAWVDGENSFDRRHVRRQGVHCGKSIRDANDVVIGYEKIALFKPEYGVFEHKKKKQTSMQKMGLGEVETAESLFTRVEMWMKLRRKQNPKGKLIVVVDSTTSFAPEEELIAAFTDQNMRTRSSNAVFLNTVTKRWVNLALHTNAIIILIAQIRTNPGKMFGNPEYTPGGNGILFYPANINWMRRVSNGEVLKEGRQVGVKGIISNKKNKVGGGSIERKRCGYIVHFFEDNWKFSSAKDMKKKKENNG